MLSGLKRSVPEADWGSIEHTTSHSDFMYHQGEQCREAGGWRRTETVIAGCHIENPPNSPGGHPVLLSLSYFPWGSRNFEVSQTLRVWDSQSWLNDDL